MLTHVTTWTDLENMINEISLTTKDEYPLILGIQNGQAHRDRSRIDVPGCGGWRESYCLRHTEFEREMIKKSSRNEQQ